uniref:DUF1738 domain-containing protein n=1 Tax=Ascaris lumbricoides TaxID=6252 RepID=A0A0M3HWH6_ASCLU
MPSGAPNARHQYANFHQGGSKRWLWNPPDRTKERPETGFCMILTWGAERLRNSSDTGGTAALNNVVRLREQRGVTFNTP